MKRTIPSLFTILLVAVGLAATGCSDSDDPAPNPINAPMAMNIVETAVAAGSFSTLVTAVETAGLAETLSNPGPYTVFAPTDAAFAKLPAGTVESLLQPENRDTLIAILTYHVVPDGLNSGLVLSRSSLPTVQGGSLSVSTQGSSAFINDAQIIQVDIEASNGIIHVIDTVLIPN